MDLISPKAGEFFLQQLMGAGAGTHDQTLSREGPNWRFPSGLFPWSSGNQWKRDTVEL